MPLIPHQAAVIAMQTIMLLFMLVTKFPHMTVSRSMTGLLLRFLPVQVVILVRHSMYGRPYIVLLHAEPVILVFQTVP